jgi:sterol desaturase/sphingolipid hydroxylase (fatty acid hydroxylase superfamily)
VLTVLGVLVGFVIGVLSLVWLPGLALRPLVLALPDVARTLLGVVLFDLATYWVHRWSHEVPFLWRFHRVHHSTARLDWVSGVRGHPFDGALLAPPFVFLLAAGFTAELAGALAVVQVVTGLFLHANVRWRWRPLHRVVITPEFHHWHHADEPTAHNSNYSVFLPLWDLLFGTYYMPDDKRPQRYGVTPPLPPGFAALIAQPFAGLPGPRQVLTHPLRTLRSARAAMCRGLHQIVASTRRRAEPGS